MHAIMELIQIGFFSTPGLNFWPGQLKQQLCTLSFENSCLSSTTFRKSVMKDVNSQLPTTRLLADIISASHFVVVVNKLKKSMHHHQLQSPSSHHPNYRKLQNLFGFFFRTPPSVTVCGHQLKKCTQKCDTQHSCLTDGETETKAKLFFQDYTASQWQSTITFQSLLVPNPIILFPKSISTTKYAVSVMAVNPPFF